MSPSRHTTGLTIVSCKSLKLLGCTRESNPVPLSPKESALPNELVCKLEASGHETKLKKWPLHDARKFEKQDRTR